MSLEEATVSGSLPVHVQGEAVFWPLQTSTLAQLM